MNQQPDPRHIMQTATAFWASKTLLTAVGFDLFSALGDGSMTARQLGDELGLHPRAACDFFDALVALRFLERDGDGSGARYRNTAETALFLDRNSPSYVGGLLEMLNARVFGFWNDLGTAVKTGQPQNELKHRGKSFFETLYADEKELVRFLEAMSGAQKENFRLLAEKFDFSRYDTVSDIGGALALLSRTVGARHPHLRFTSFDLPPVTAQARKRIEEAGMSDRIEAVPGDFLVDSLPGADVITMGMILHDWNLEKKKLLVRKAYEALPDRGALIAIEHLIDDARRENAFGLLMSLNMLIEFGDAFDFTGAEFIEWCSEAGFRRFEIIPLTDIASAAVAHR